MKIEIDLPDHLTEWLQSDELRRQLARRFQTDESPFDVPEDLAARAALVIEYDYHISNLEPVEIPF